MSYVFKIIDIHDKKKLITYFDDEESRCLEDILNSDTISVEQIIECIDCVVSKKYSYEEVGNERCIIQITVEESEIYDNFIGLIDDSELYSTIKMSTSELREFLILWKSKKEEFLKSHNEFIGDSVRT